MIYKKLLNMLIYLEEWYKDLEIKKKIKQLIKDYNFKWLWVCLLQKETSHQNIKIRIV